MTQARQLTEPCCAHGEGPVWDARAERLALVDMLRGDVIFVGADGATRRTHVASIAAALRPRTDGGWVLGIERGFALADAELRRVESLGEIWSDPAVRMNDGACDPGGRFFCGTTADDGRAGAGVLYRLDSDESVHSVLEGVSVSNGLGWSPCGTVAYYVDSATQRVDAFDYDLASGTFSNRRTLAEIPTADGVPDGLTVDAAGGVWIALYGGAAVRRYLPGGELDQQIEIPVSYPTACCFGGVDRVELYVTTSTLGVTLDSEPAAGSVFVCRPGVTGLPVAEYRMREQRAH